MAIPFTLLGLFSRHSSINDEVKRAFSSAKIPAILEKTGLCRSEATCSDPLASSNLTSAKSSGRCDKEKTYRKQLLFPSIRCGDFWEMVVWCYAFTTFTKFDRGNTFFFTLM